MADLSTTYMGFKLQNPLIVASCSLTNTVEGVQRCADAGAGAVVLKSMFEEQIEANAHEIQKHVWLSGHTEAYDYVRQVGIKTGEQDYLNLLEGAKKAVAVPVIASLNCVTPDWWTDYARRLESSGADGIELNIAVLVSDPRHTSKEIEDMYYRILESVGKSVSIPVAVKIGPYFTSLANTASGLCARGASALVLFNRFYQLDINIDKLDLVPAYHFSTPEELNFSLRWMSLLAGRVKCDLAATTGVHDAGGFIKQLLVGAAAVQICSTLYKHGIGRIAQILSNVELWMKKHQFESVAQFQGRLSQKASGHPEAYERLQYIKALVGLE
ncbi:dihydroorotate dehydrogenase-like protein [candidate division WOR-3 bacterium]|nr:dihydroorotate dehydrogenase-like protein [candidate division WOR-3 bacterium]